MTTFADTIEEISTTINDAKKKAEAALMGAMKDVFDAYPDVKVIKWTQYTPSFSDGDPCEFTIGEVTASNYVEIDAYGEWEGDEENEPADLKTSFSKQTHPLLNEVISFIISSLGEEIVKFMFGNDVQITVTRDGVDVTDYDCGY